MNSQMARSCKGKFIWYGKGGMKILKIEAWNFSSPPRKRFNFLGAPTLPLVLKYTNFRCPPFGCLKIFGAPPKYLHPPPALVILNELSLDVDVHYCRTGQGLTNIWRVLTASKLLLTIQRGHYNKKNTHLHLQNTLVLCTVLTLTKRKNPGWSYFSRAASCNVCFE